jgi:hypothetical protein
MNDGKDPHVDEIAAEGRVSMDLTDASGTVEANAPLKIAVGDRTRWTARGQTIESSHAEVRRYMRRALYALKPPPQPRDPLPVPKPKPSRPKGIPCPACRGKGVRRDYTSGDVDACSLCHGAGVTTEALATAWLEEFGNELA